MEPFSTSQLTVRKHITKKTQRVQIFLHIFTKNEIIKTCKHKHALNLCVIHSNLIIINLLKTAAKLNF